MSSFIVYPAIDLREGRVVRLKQGDPKVQTIYSDDPGQVANKWLNAGASWLHIVNLDGAMGLNAGKKNLAALREIQETYGSRLRIQFGGGLRDFKAIENALLAGVSRVVIGTAAIADRVFARRILQEFGAKSIAFALDARHGILMTQGWQHSSGQDLAEFTLFLAKIDAKHVVYTNVARDGMGSGIDWQRAKEIAMDTRLSVIASGGVASLSDVRRVKSAGLDGVIIGRALYDNQLSLAEVLAC
jgi:phosphoribosylformimino-5-aminoimidazole carboxamide ribotide isomerase